MYCQNNTTNRETSFLSDSQSPRFVARHNTIHSCTIKSIFKTVHSRHALREQTTILKTDKNVLAPGNVGRATKKEIPLLNLLLGLNLWRTWKGSMHFLPSSKYSESILCFLSFNFTASSERAKIFRMLTKAQKRRPWMPLKSYRSTGLIDYLWSRHSDKGTHLDHDRDVWMQQRSFSSPFQNDSKSDSTPVLIAELHQQEDKSVKMTW